jgi:glycosyltransferase involved in cell wall biosynthesis
MKICYITAEYPPRIGGVGDYVRHLSREMAARGYDVTVVTSAGLGDVSDADNGRSPRVLPVIKKWNLLCLPALLKVLAAVSADVYILEYVGYMYGRGGIAPWLLFLFLVFKLGNKTVILNAHETWRPRYRKAGASVLTFISFVIFCSGIWASTKIVVTNRFRELLLTGVLGVDDRRVELIPAGANILPTGGAKRRADKSRELRIVTFGIWHEDRTTEELTAVIEQLRESRSVKLFVVGGFGSSRESLARVDRLLTAPGRREWLYVTGALPPERVSAYLTQADIYVSPLNGGPSGRRGSLLAAMAHGLPIIAYDGYERDGVFRNGHNIILIEKSDSKGLYEALTSLASDEAYRRELGANARAAFEEHFSWARIADKWENLLADASTGTTEI